MIAPRDKLYERLEGIGLAGHAEALVARAHRQLRITATVDHDAPLGASRIGGHPDLPRDATWPRHRWLHADVATWPRHLQHDLQLAITRGEVIDEGVTLAMAMGFVAQLDLAELAPHQDVLPGAGHLWLFADQRTHAGERDDYPHVACAAIHAVDGELVRTQAPPVSETLRPATLAFTSELVLPDPDDLDLPDDARRACEGLAYVPDGLPRHALLPAPDYGTARFPPMGHVGVLRIDTDHLLGSRWGGGAWLTFAVPEDALCRGALDRMFAFRFIG